MGIGSRVASKEQNADYFIGWATRMHSSKISNAIYVYIAVAPTPIIGFLLNYLLKIAVAVVGISTAA